MQRPRTRAAHDSLRDAVFCCAWGRNVTTNAKIRGDDDGAVDDVRQAALSEDIEHGRRPALTRGPGLVDRSAWTVTHGAQARFSSPSANLSWTRAASSLGALVANVIS